MVFALADFCHLPTKLNDEKEILGKLPLQIPQETSLSPGSYSLLAPPSHGEAHQILLKLPPAGKRGSVGGAKNPGSKKSEMQIRYCKKEGGGQ